jgi:hypothetical protein
VLSPCCGAAVHIVYGEPICSVCHTLVAPVAIRITAQPRDIMAWALTPRDRTGKPLEVPPQPPRGEHVLVRNGKRVRKVDRIRGKPDAWYWIDA